MKQTIYETKGRAREYCKLALNHYSGCSHGCKYCYAPKVTYKNAPDFHNNVTARLTGEEIAEGASRAEKNGLSGDVLLSFTTDPYQPIDYLMRLTRYAILALQSSGFNVVVLTKAGAARRDFDILRAGIDTFATSLTCTTSNDSGEWEPKAALPTLRIYNLMEAKKYGLKTWVSCEPVIYPKQTIELIKKSAEYVDHYKIGTMNYMQHGATVNWKEFAEKIVSMQPSIGRPFYLKKDLAKYIGKSEGYWVGL